MAFLYYEAIMDDEIVSTSVDEGSESSGSGTGDREDIGFTGGTLFDWSMLQIEEHEIHEGIGRIDEDEIYITLGLRDEDDSQHGATAQFASQSSFGPQSNGADLNDYDADVLVDDDILESFNILHDVDRPEMHLGIIYPSMVKFRLAVRQYAINEEFLLGTIKSDKERYRVYCQGNGGQCPWRLNGSKKPDGSVMVL